VIFANELFTTETLFATLKIRNTCNLPRDMMLQSFMRTMYNVRMKTPQAKGKRALSFEEHICFLCACGQVCAWPEVLPIQAANNVLRKQLLIPSTICHLEKRPQRYRALET